MATQQGDIHIGGCPLDGDRNGSFKGNEPSPLCSVESYNMVKRRWEYVTPMPTGRCSSALIQTPSMLFVIGGVAQGPSNAVEALCLQETV